MGEPLIRALLYRAIRELAYIHELEGSPRDIASMIVSSEGVQIIAQSMRALGVKDLSQESLDPELRRTK